VSRPGPAQHAEQVERAPYQLTTREIARRTLVTAGAISQRLARAERAGLVVRSAGQGGGRSVTVTLTEAGHAVVERTVDAVLGREAQLVDGLSEADRTALAGLLDRLLSEVAGRVRTAADGSRLTW